MSPPKFWMNQGRCWKCSCTGSAVIRYFPSQCPPGGRGFSRQMTIRYGFQARSEVGFTFCLLSQKWKVEICLFKDS